MYSGNNKHLNQLAEHSRADLLAVARSSIHYGLMQGCALSVDEEAYPQALRTIRATFVTLQIDERLRGCIGTLEARSPLVQDVADHAYAAAFKDPRFAPLSKHEFAGLDVHIAVLSPPQPFPVASRSQLFSELRPGIDGLILQCGGQQATFLPAVWESLPQPEDFVAHLLQKAGFAKDYWSSEMRFERYTTESFP